MRPLAREDGFTLPEVLVGMLLMMIVMFASLNVLDQFRQMHTRADSKVDLQDEARAVSRQLARSLRNLAGSPERPGVVERADPYDLVFRVVDAPRADSAQNVRNLKRVRYCLDASDPSRARLFEQTQRWDSATSPPVPAGAGCPSADWDDSRLVADRMTNRANGTDRPLWTYVRTGSGEISALKVNLFVNDQPASRAREVALQTGIFLRNQNRAPTALFTAAVTGLRHIILNASGSSDPEGQSLDFIWHVDGAEVGRGMIYDYAAPGPGTHVIRLEVRDPGGLVGMSAPQEVTVQ